MPNTGNFTLNLSRTHVDDIIDSWLFVSISDRSVVVFDKI